MQTWRTAGRGRSCQAMRRRGDDAEGFDVGMATDGASHHDSQGAVLGPEGSAIVNEANDVGGTR